MDNFRGTVLLVAAMALFACEDVMVKMTSGAWPVGQILAVLGGVGGLVFALIATAQGHRVISRDFLNPAVVLRNLGEIIGTIGFVTALALTPMSSAAAIIQSMPLFVTMGAALFLNETVGWRRWTAIGVGFIGVLLIIRPGLDGFTPASLFALQGAVGLAMRDVATRRIPAHIPTMKISAYGFGSLLPPGLIMLWLQGQTWQPATPDITLLISGALFFGLLGYYALTAATRIGEVSFVVPFRYTRLLFSIGLGWLFFGEVMDSMTTLGATIIILSGLYSLLRERQLARRP